MGSQVELPTVGEGVVDIVKSYAQNVPRKDATGYEIPDTCLGERRKLRIIVIGFGAAAINLAHVFKDPKKKIDIQCYEKNPEVGGTWYENRLANVPPPFAWSVLLIPSSDIPDVHAILCVNQASVTPV